MSCVGTPAILPGLVMLHWALQFKEKKYIYIYMDHLEIIEDGETRITRK